MTNKYKQLTESIKGRINPDNFAFNESFNNELSTLSYSEVLTYIRLAMKGVEPEYTRRSKEAGEKVKEHLSSVLIDVVFRYQGSVMTDTHIRGYSDIDLLTICKKFYSYDASGINKALDTKEKKSELSYFDIQKLLKIINSINYTGNPEEDLREIRTINEKTLNQIYQICDITKPKSIKIKNKSLNREVDVVVAGWYHDVSTILEDNDEYKGIQIYNKDTHRRENPDFPFLSISRINEKSSETNGRLKRMIRFLKNIKVDSKREIQLTSFDINAICYDINTVDYRHLSFYELVPVIYKQLKLICINQSIADNIVSVDGKEHIFRYKAEKLENLRMLLSEVEGIFIDLKQDIGI